ncbi:hypothetical protein ES288_D09G069800v1 [Gossypium darwinii]|uniref:Uncharacterized protein n=1 Tax=Gossypium darwinii TaxID=34276 RepID=A0A5D2BB90_GOSDA|nr:hypothetical protein ES288_D09G069800v1 [Gossypium darwinii]
MSIKNFSPLLHSFQTHFFRLFFLFLGSSFSLSAKIFDFFRLLFFRSLRLETGSSNPLCQSLSSSLS